MLCPFPFAHPLSFYPLRSYYLLLRKLLAQPYLLQGKGHNKGLSKAGIP